MTMKEKKMNGRDQEINSINSGFGGKKKKAKLLLVHLIAFFLLLSSSLLLFPSRKTNEAQKNQRHSRLMAGIIEKPTLKKNSKVFSKVIKIIPEITQWLRALKEEAAFSRICKVKLDLLSITERNDFFKSSVRFPKVYQRKFSGEPKVQLSW